MKTFRITVGLILALAAGTVQAADRLTIAGATPTPWIVKGDGQLLAETNLTIRNSGNPVKLWASISLPDRSALVVALGEVAAGESKHRIRHPEVANSGDKVEWAVFDNEKCAGEALARAIHSLPKARRWTIYVNHDMHQDVGYTAWQEDLKRKIWPGYLDKTIECINQSSQWPDAARARQEIESSMQLYDSALIARNADWIDNLKQLIGDGRISYSATFGSLAQENCSAEALVRSNYYSRRHLHDMLGGGASAVANMADNNSLCWSAVDALTGAGVKYYTLRLWGAESRWRAPAPLFYVEAQASGRRLLVCNYGDYTKEPFGLRSGKIDAVRQAIEARLMSLQNSADYPYDAVLCQFTNSDNGPPSPGVYQMIRDLNALGYEYPRIRCALPEEFYRHVEQGFKDKIPVVRGNFENWWNWGVGSTAYETAAHKQAHDTLAAAEMLATFAAAAGAQRSYPYEQTAEAWKNLVLYAEHTWGSKGSGVDAQWLWKRNTALGPEVTASALLRDAMSAMSARVAGDGPALVVWNFTPWKRTDVVRVDSSALPAGSAPADVDGKPIAVQDCEDGMRSFVAGDVPPLGSKAFRIVQARSTGPHAQMTATAEQLENRFFRIRFDPAGNIVSILDKTRGERELVDANCPERLNQFVYWYENKTPFTVRKATLKASVGPAMASVTADGACFGVDSMKRTVILHADIDRIDIVNDLVKSPSGFGGRGKGWPKEEGYFVFPLNVPSFLLRHDMPAGNVRPIVDPNTGALEQLPTTCTDHFTVKSWVDVSNQKDFGLTLSCIDAPLVMYGGRRARTFDVNYKCKAPWVYSYLFNNLWYTNFQKTQPGRVVFRYSIRPHNGGDWLAGGAHRFGIETNSPLRAAPARGSGTGAAPAGSLLAIDQPNVALIAAKPAEANGEGAILRFNELEGRETKATVDLARLNPKAVVATDLVENDQSPIVLAGTKATFTIPGFGFATLRVIFGDAAAAAANVKAATDSHGTLVSWDAVAGATHYEVFRGTKADFAAGPGFYLATASTTHFLDRQVPATVKGAYHYRVRAVTPGRKGAPSASVAAAVSTINDTAPPAAPALFARALRFDKVALSWETPTDNVAVKGYKLLRDGLALADLPAVYNSWMDVRTDPDKTYQYAIRAYDDAGNLSEPGQASVSTAGFVVPPDTPPAEALRPVSPTPGRGLAPATQAAKPGNLAPAASVMVSSEYSADFAGKHVVDGICATNEQGEWASAGEPKPWVRLQWKEPVTVARIVIYDRPNGSDHAIAGRLTFSDGDPAPVTDIDNNGTPSAIVLPPRKIKWLKFEVTESAGKNIGLSEIEVYGDN